jgi:hypothetical protein
MCLSNSPLGGPRHKSEDNIKAELQVIGWEACIGLIWLTIGTDDGLFNAVLNIQVT